MDSIEDVERKLAKLSNDFDLKVTEIKEQKSKLKSLNKEKRELQHEIRKTLREYRKFF